MRVTKESGFEFYYLINTFLLTIGVIPITAKLFKFQIFNSKNITKPMETKSMEKLEPIHNNNSLTKDMENTSEERLEEERLYEFVMKELKSGERREGLWTKAMVQASGDEKQTEIRAVGAASIYLAGFTSVALFQLALPLTIPEAYVAIYAATGALTVSIFTYAVILHIYLAILRHHLKKIFV